MARATVSPNFAAAVAAISCGNHQSLLPGSMAAAAMVVVLLLLLLLLL